MHIQVLTPSRYNAGHRTRTGITLRVFLQHVRLDRESARSGLISLVWGKNRENYSETPILDIKKRGGAADYSNDDIISRGFKDEGWASNANDGLAKEFLYLGLHQYWPWQSGATSWNHRSKKALMRFSPMKNWVQAWPYQERPLAKTRAGFTPGTNPF